MALILVRDHTGSRYMPRVTTLHYQVTGASGFIGSHVVDELLRQGYSVRGYAYILSMNTTQYTYRPMMTVVSAVRSHNVARISKSYKSFGDRFTTTVIDDIATSDLVQAVKGLCHASLLSASSS
jgi:UDP-glucose 4-epimerase